MKLHRMRLALGSRWLRLVFAAALLAWLFVRYDIRIGPATWASLSAPAWLAVTPAIMLFLNPLLSARRIQLMLEYVGVHETLSVLVRIIFLSAFFGLVVPSTVGADAVRLVLIERRHPARRGSTSAAVLADKALGLLILALLGLAGALLVAKRAGMQPVWLALAVSAAVVAALFVATHARTERLVASGLARLRVPAVMTGYLTTASSTLAAIPLGRAFPRILPLALGYQLGMIVVVWALFRAFGVDIPLSAHAAFVPISLIIATLPASIGGLGLREGAFVYFYGLIGVSPDISFAVSILLFALGMGIGAAVGGLWAVALHVRGDDVMETP